MSIFCFKHFSEKVFFFPRYFSNNFLFLLLPPWLQGLYYNQLGNTKSSLEVLKRRRMTSWFFFFVKSLVSSAVAIWENDSRKKKTVSQFLFFFFLLLLLFVSKQQCVACCCFPGKQLTGNVMYTQRNRESITQSIEGRECMSINTESNLIFRVCVCVCVCVYKL